MLSSTANYFIVRIRTCLIHFTKLSDYTPNLPHLDYRTFPHLIRMFKRNLFKEYQEYWSKSLNKDKFDSSVGNKWSLYSEVKNEVRFESYLDFMKNVKTRVAVTKNANFLPLATYWIWALQEDTQSWEALPPFTNRSEITHPSLSHIRDIFLVDKQ